MFNFFSTQACYNIGDDRHVVTINIQCPLYGDAHHMELKAYPTYILNAMFHGAEFGAKHWGPNCRLLLWKPVNHSIVEEDDKVSSQVWAHFVTSMVAVHEHTQSHPLSKGLWGIVQNCLQCTHIDVSQSHSMKSYFIMSSSFGSKTSLELLFDLRYENTYTAFSKCPSRGSAENEDNMEALAQMLICPSSHHCWMLISCM